MSGLGAANDPVVDSTDAIDIPVVVRKGPGQRRASTWCRTEQSWPATGNLPAVGEYCVATTWRDVLDAAMTVGRDLGPWLDQYPERASQELMARVAPLQAYLTRERTPPGVGGRWRLVPSLAYTQGAEHSARGAFAYRLGMTMAEWACRGLMGLGPTTHAESAAPHGITDWLQAGSRPDLFADHRQDDRTWLIEAKAARRIGLGKLREGEKQLIAGGALLGGRPHRLVLCGASIEDQVFMTIDDLPSSGDDGMVPSTPSPPHSPRPWEDMVGSDAEALLAVARSRMLIYFHLRYASAKQRRIVPVAAQATHARPGFGLSRLLDQDEATLQLRRRLHAQPPANGFRLVEQPGVQAMITAPLFGTGIRLGMSTHLFAACTRLHEEQRRILEQTLAEQGPLETDIDGRTPGGPDVISTHLFRHISDRVPEGPDMQRLQAEHQARIHGYRRREAEQREVLREAVGEAFATGDEQSSDWLLAAQLEIDPDGGTLLEAATAETYLAIDPQSPTLRAP